MRLKKLFFWLGLGTVTLAAATTIAYSSNKTKIYSHNKPTKKICVSVKGAVAHPNKYFFNEGVKIRDVFKKVRVLPSADITKIDFNEVLTKNRTITVPYKLSDSKDGRIAKIH